MALTLQFCKHTFAPVEPDELPLKLGEPVFIIETDEEFGDGWWKGITADGKTGLFPSTYVSTENARNLDVADFEAALARKFPTFKPTRAPAPSPASNPSPLPSAPTATTTRVGGLVSQFMESEPPSRTESPDISSSYSPEHVSLTAPTQSVAAPPALPFAVPGPVPATAMVPMPSKNIAPGLASKVALFAVSKPAPLPKASTGSSVPAPSSITAKPQQQQQQPATTKDMRDTVKAPVRLTPTVVEVPIALEPGTTSISPQPSIVESLPALPEAPQPVPAQPTPTSAPEPKEKAPAAPKKTLPPASAPKKSVQPTDPNSAVQKLRQLYGTTSEPAPVAPAAVKLGPTSSAVKRAAAVPAKSTTIDLGLLPPSHPDRWTTSELTTWLASIRLPDVAQAFAERSVTGKDLPDISLSNLRQKYGVESLGSRMSLMHAIVALKERYGLGQTKTEASSTTEAKVAVAVASPAIPTGSPVMAIMSEPVSPSAYKAALKPVVVPKAKEAESVKTSTSVVPKQVSLHAEPAKPITDSTRLPPTAPARTVPVVKKAVIRAIPQQQSQPRMTAVGVQTSEEPSSPATLTSESADNVVADNDPLKQYAKDAASLVTCLEPSTLTDTPSAATLDVSPPSSADTSSDDLLKLDIQKRGTGNLVDEVLSAIDNLDKDWLEEQSFYKAAQASAAKLFSPVMSKDLDLSLPPLDLPSVVSEREPGTPKMLRHVRSRSVVLPVAAKVVTETTESPSKTYEDISAHYRYSGTSDRESTAAPSIVSTDAAKPLGGMMAGAAPTTSSARTRTMSNTSSEASRESSSLEKFGRFFRFGGPPKISKPEVRIDYAAQGPVDREGWLYVKSPQDPDANKWKKRWCVLLGSTLYMTNGPGDTYVHCSVPLHQHYSIEPDHSTSFLDRSKTQYRFRASNSNARSFVFCAETQVVMVQWIDSLVRATARAAKPPVQLRPISTPDRTSDDVLASAVHFDNRLILPMASSPISTP